MKTVVYLRYEPPSPPPEIGTSHRALLNFFVTSDLITPPPPFHKLLIEIFDIAEISLCTGRLPSRFVIRRKVKLVRNKAST